MYNIVLLLISPNRARERAGLLGDMGWIAAFCQWRFTEDKNLNTIKNIKYKITNMNIGEICFLGKGFQFSENYCIFRS